MMFIKACKHIRCMFLLVFCVFVPGLVAQSGGEQSGQQVPDAVEQSALDQTPSTTVRQQDVIDDDDAHDDDSFGLGKMSDEFLTPAPPSSWVVLQGIRLGSLLLYCYFQAEKGALVVYDKTLRILHVRR